MKITYNDWKILPLFTTALIAGVITSALLNAVASVQAANISELTVDERLAMVREQLKQRRKELTDKSHPLSLLQDNLETDSKNNQLKLSQYWNKYWNNCFSNWRNGPRPYDWRSWYNC